MNWYLTLDPLVHVALFTWFLVTLIRERRIT
jgi:hypothetical protein